VTVQNRALQQDAPGTSRHLVRGSDMSEIEGEMEVTHSYRVSRKAAWAESRRSPKASMPLAQSINRLSSTPRRAASSLRPSG
jgi:hypothetical protein